MSQKYIAGTRENDFKTYAHEILQEMDIINFICKAQVRLD